MKGEDYHDTQSLVPAAALSAAAARVYESFVSGGISYVITSTAEGSKQVQVMQNNPAYTGDVVIPESVTYEGESYSVTSISNNAFGYCTSLTSVSIPSSVTEICESAFEKCTSLTAVNFAQDSTLTKIDQIAFQSTGLKSVTIPSSVTVPALQSSDRCKSPIKLDHYRERCFYRERNNRNYDGS